MDTLRNSHQITPDGSQEIIFQCLEWIGTNEVKEVKNDNPKSKYKFKKVFEHVIKIYGVTKEGHSISLNNNGFQPYFYIKVPDDTSQMMKLRIIQAIKNAMDNRQANSIVSAKFIKKKDFYGFTNNKLYTFIKLTFENSTAMSKCNQVIKDGVFIPGKEKKERVFFKIYESNIKPFIRFMHTKELKGAGWVRIKPYSYQVNSGDKKSSTCQIDIDIDYNDIEYYDDNSICQMLIASFDIECSSSHGDFPLAKKNYKKLATEIYDLYQKEDKLNKYSKIDGIHRLNDYLTNAFQESSAIDDISVVYTKDNDKPHPVALEKIAKKIYYLLNRPESYKIMALDILKYFYNSEYDNISIFKNIYKPVIKSIIEDAFSNTWEDKNNKMVETIYTKTNKKPAKTTVDNLVAKCYRQIVLLYKKINKSFEENGYEIDNGTIQEIIYLYCRMEHEDVSKIIEKVVNEYELEEQVISLVINNISFCINGMYSYLEELCPEIDTSRDTYCKRITHKFNYSLPAIEGDKVIQIGTTIKRYGEDGCFLKHIITLNTCSKIDGSVVEAYDNERDVLLAWTKFIQNLDPDIITGYNIFGFDFAFMWHRAEELDCVEEFAQLGRSKIKDKKSGEYLIKKSFLESKKLSSSALGDNILKYITMDGRIMMDLLKVVQKDFNLVSYKLDYVAEHFINDKIKDINKNVLTINGSQTLNVGNYITISYGGDETYCDSKFKILQINDHQITLDMSPKSYIQGTIKDQILGQKPKWTLAKDDVSPQDIFRLQEGSADDRRIVAVYCIQDCALCINLIDKLKIITNNIGMANVCSVPLSYLFTRGQGVKIFSLVSQQCRKENFLIPVIKCDREEISISPDEQPSGFDYGEEEDAEVLNNDDGYEGAIVLKPKPGIYLKKPVSVLDYASLYPSSMISENLSHDSYVMEDHEDSKIYLGEEGAKKLKEIGYDYEDIPHDVYKWVNPRIKSKGKVKCGVKICRFVQPLNGSKCVIPNKLRELLKARKDTRKLIKFKTLISKDGEKYSGLLEDKKESDSYILTDQKGNKKNYLKSSIDKVVDTYTDFEKSVYDGLQLAFKLTANSLYGQIGAGTSPIYLKDIAASTTATGRKLLHLAKEKVEEKFDGAEIVYGDSVTADTPMILKNKYTKNIEFKTIDSIEDENWIPYNNFKPFDTDRYGKEQQLTNTYMIYTSNGWSNIRRVIRHKTHKKIYRITTHTGMVDVTEDHSLLDESGNILKPTEAKVGHRLLHTYPQFPQNNIKLSDIMNYIENIGSQCLHKKKAFIDGFFYGDGSCGYYECKSGNKYSWALNNSDLEYCLILQSLLEEIYDTEFKILDTYNSSNVYKIVPHGQIKNYVIEYRDKFYTNNRLKQIPLEIINGSYDERYAFLCGYYSADGYKCVNSKSKNIILTNKGKIGSSMLYYLTRSLGFEASINTRTDKRDIIQITCSGKLRKNDNVIKKIEYLRDTVEDEYVYDIETDVGNFNTGFPLIVKNTDSIFIDFKPKDDQGNFLENKAALKKSIEMGLQSEEYIQDFLKPPHKLEYEKTFWPFILFSKKRYIGNKYEFKIGDDDYVQTSMGIVLKRRDNAKIVKHVYGGVINILMNKKNVEMSIKFLREELYKLLDGKFPLDLLIITKSLRGYYKNPESIAHKVLADRMGVRDPGNKPSSNDRIPYAYIDTHGKKIKLQGDRIEHPDYIREHNLKPDYMFYITNQIMKPVGQIYSLIAEDLEGFKYGKDHYDKKYKMLIKTLEEPKVIGKINDMRYKDATDIVFGDVLRVANNRKTKSREITDFFKVSRN